MSIGFPGSDPNSFYIPIPPYPFEQGPRFNPTFDGQFAHGTTTNPFVNTLFEITNATQSRIFQDAQLESMLGLQGMG